MYWDMVFLRQRTYFSTSSITTSAIIASKGGCAHYPDVSRYGCIPTKWRATMWWKVPRVRPIMGVITQVSNLNKRFAWSTAL